MPLQAHWRKDGSEAEKLADLTTLAPGAAHWMAGMGERDQNIDWAAKQEKREFTMYQAEEIEKLVETRMLARPARAGAARLFHEKVFPALNKAIEKDPGSLRAGIQYAAQRVHGLPCARGSRLRHASSRARDSAESGPEHEVMTSGQRRCWRRRP
ncbi:MAG: hypothetical protein P8Z78_02735 [Gammaproteobacteria bacterium]|jgi:hypothetical protein